MDGCCLGLLLIVVFLLQMDFSHPVYITDNIDSLNQVLSEFDIIRPIRTDSEGRFLSAFVSHHLHPSSRHASHAEDLSTETDNVRRQRLTISDVTQVSPSNHTARRRRRWTYTAEEAELYYNVTVFGRELHLRLRPNSQLIAPTATIEWEESGHLSSQPIEDTGCFYTGTVSDMKDTTVAVSGCDGLAGIIRTGLDEFFIEPLNGHRTDGKDGDKDGGRQHIVYRSSAIRKQPSVSLTAEDFLQGPLLGSLHLDPDVLKTTSGSARRRRYIEEAELFNIEVLLAVDYSVLLFHGKDNIQRYLLTLMNIVNDIYRDHSLGANINVVLVKIIMLSPTKSQELISVGDPQKSLENVCGWSYLQQREQSQAEQHDHTIYLTRQEFGPSGMQGYAPVTGMCQLHRSCVLVLEDGFSSAFVAAHETGHVLGMNHDGEANTCDDDVPLGSIMSPRVQATFYRYHWSRCSWRELHQYLHTYDCLRDDPFHHDWPAQPLLPGFQYSMEQQCHFNFGPGSSLCTAYTNHEPCKQLWCSDYNNPFFCKTKKGPPLDGTKCGPGQHCFKGFCMRLTPDLLRQDGGWGTWSWYGSCSRTCGRGVRSRTRRCDNPAPANGGHRCFGNSYEFQLCGQTDCPPLTDFREDQCKVWNQFFEHDGKKHHWLPYEHPDPDERCRLYCQSEETAAVVFMDRMVHDGTSCSYSDAYSLCVRGECEHVGCDGQIASDQQEDRCGVCGGDNSSCRVVKGNFTRSTRKQGYLKILEIPKGARHLLIQEFKGSPHVLAVKNQETGHLFLNSEDELPESRTVISKGVAWEYRNGEERESIRTTGPLKYGVLLMVRSHGDSKVTVSYKYIIQDRLRSTLESNLVQEDTLFYEWALKRWSVCSRPCGGGKQYTRFGCRRKADGKMVHRMLCSAINKPRAISRNCNTDTCSSPRWVTGDWGDCSASCGQTGWQHRLVSCQVESSKEQQQRSSHSKLCGDNRPDNKRTCNRFPCPPTWRAGPWTRCSVSCGNGTQERQVACSASDGSDGNCSEPRPITTRSCQASRCRGDQKNHPAIIQWLSRSNSSFPSTNISTRQRCRGDRSVFCQMEVLNQYCSIAGYRQMCCKSCSEANGSSATRPTTTGSSWISTSKRITSTSIWSDSSDIISDITTPPSLMTVTPALIDQSSHDYVHMENYDYDEYSSYEDPSGSSEHLDSIHFSTSPTTTGTTDTTATSTTRHLRKTAPPHLFQRKMTTVFPATVPIVTTGNPELSEIQTTSVPEFHPTTSTHLEDIISSTSSETKHNLQETKPAVTPMSPFFTPTKTENSSVNEVPYRIVGLDRDVNTGLHHHFVPRMPPFHERTQNKRIQEVLNEKRQQGLQRRTSRNRASRTDRRQSGPERR